jgi:hypothetical protein
MEFKAAAKELHHMGITGSAGFHGAANMEAQDADPPSEALDPSSTNVYVMMTATAAATLAAKLRQRSYLWTHGTMINIRHNIETCSDKGDGQPDDATDANKFGGSHKCVW